MIDADQRCRAQRSALSGGVLGERGWDVASAVEDAPDVDVGVVFDVERDVWISAEVAGPEVGDVEFVGEPQGSDPWVA